MTWDDDDFDELEPHSRLVQAAIRLEDRWRNTRRRARALRRSWQEPINWHGFARTRGCFRDYWGAPANPWFQIPFVQEQARQWMRRWQPWAPYTPPVHDRVRDLFPRVEAQRGPVEFARER